VHVYIVTTAPRRVICALCECNNVHLYYWNNLDEQSTKKVQDGTHGIQCNDVVTSFEQLSFLGLVIVCPHKPILIAEEESYQLCIIRQLFIDKLSNNLCEYKKFVHINFGIK